MPVSVTMPRLGESVTEGTVTRWLKQEGDRVEVDEPLLEVSTDKVDTEIPSPAAGVLSRIVVGEDQTVEVGSELAVIAGDGEDAGTAAPPAESQQAGAAESPEAAAAPASTEQAAPSEDAEEATPPEKGAAGRLAEQSDAQQAEAKPAEAQQAEAKPAEPKQADTKPAEAQQAEAAPAQTAPAGGAQASGQASGQATAVKMPALGESVTEGTVTRWLKQVGEQVEVDEPLLEVSTDKVDTEIPSPVAGTVLEIKVAEDETAAVGAELVLIGAAEGAAAPAEAPAPEKPAAAGPRHAEKEPPEPEKAAEPGKAAEPATPAAEQAKAAEAPAPQAAERPSAEADKPAASAEASAEVEGGYITPLVRKLAAEKGIDLSTLTGSGVGGRIRKQDVLEAADRAAEAAKAEAAKAEAAKAEAAKAQPAAAEPAAAKPAAKTTDKIDAAKAEPSPLRGRTEKMSRLRAVIAKRMVESLQVSAQLTTVVEVDVTKIAKLRDQAKGEFLKTHGVKLSFLPFFALASVEALRVHPTVNASINMDEGTVTYHDAEHLGLAVDTERGLVVPVIRDAGDLNLAGLAKRIADLAQRTRTNKISPDELSGGTFTLTNTGSRGALFDTPIINQPQVAILGTGAVVKRAVVVDESDLGALIVPRSMVYLALSYDHRLVDGADAARFLATVKERLEAGAFENDLGLN